MSVAWTWVAVGVTVAVLVLYEVLAKFKTLQMVNVHLPTTDGRELPLSRCTQPEAEHRMLLEQLRLCLPNQPPPKITAVQARQATTELTM